jgi:hypothetical protein
MVRRGWEQKAGGVEETIAWRRSSVTEDSSPTGFDSARARG